MTKVWILTLLLHFSNSQEEFFPTSQAQKSRKTKKSAQLLKTNCFLEILNNKFILGSGKYLHSFNLPAFGHGDFSGLKSSAYLAKEFCRLP